MFWYRRDGNGEYERWDCQAVKRDNIRKGVFVSVKNNKITIDFHIIVSYGVSISTVASNLMESVKYRVEEFTSLEVERINIYVEGVKDIG